MSLCDKLLYSLFVLAAVTLAALNYCVMDWLWGTATVAVVLAWAYLLHRRCRRTQQEPSHESDR